MNWLRDIFGLSQWAVAWRWEKTNGYIYSGRTDQFAHIQPLSMRGAMNLARDMNRLYGKDTHWPVRMQP